MPFSSYFKRFMFESGKSDFNAIRAGFYDDVAEAIADSEALRDFLEAEKANARKQKQTGMGLVLDRMLKRYEMDEGSLATMFQTIVPKQDLLVLRAIDDMKDKPEGLRFLAFTITKTTEMLKVLKAELRSPITLFVSLLITVLTVTFAYIPPELEMVPDVSQWDPIGQSLYGMSYAITYYWPLLLLLTVGPLVWLKWAMPRWTGRLRRRMDKRFPFRLYRDYHGAIFLISLASMLITGKAGLVESLERLRKETTPWLRWHIRQILDNLTTNPDDYGKAFSTGILSPEIERRLAMYARRKNFSEGLIRLGREGIDHVLHHVRRSAARFSMIVMVLIGLALIYVYAGSTYSQIRITQIMQTQQDNQAHR